MAQLIHPKIFFYHPVTIICMHITIPELSGPVLINLSPGHRAFQAMDHFAWFCLHFSMSAIFLPHHMMTRAARSVCWLPSVTLTVTQGEKAVETDLRCLRMCSNLIGISLLSSSIYSSRNPPFLKYPKDSPQSTGTFEAKLLYHRVVWHSLQKLKWWLHTHNTLL